MNRTIKKRLYGAALSASSLSLLISHDAAAQLWGCTAQPTPQLSGNPGGQAVSPNTSYFVEDNDFNADQQQTITACLATGSFTTAGSSGVLGYPNVLQGRAFGQPTSPNFTTTWPNQKAIQVSAIKSWPVSWDIGGTTGAGGGSGANFWNAAIEAWAWTFDPGTSFPSSEHPDGTEFMIWLNASPGTTPGGFTPIGPVNIDGVSWNRYIAGGGGSLGWNGNQGTMQPTHWNYVAYLPANGVRPTSFVGDLRPFLDDAEAQTSSGSSVPCQNGAQGNGHCLSDNWFLTSVQAGFEIAGAGAGLTSNCFSSQINGPPFASPSPGGGNTGWAGIDVPGKFRPPPTPPTAMIGKAIGSGWAIGSDVKNTYTNPTRFDYGIYQFVPTSDFVDGHWNEVTGGADTISVDLNGTPWIVNAVGNIYKWNGTNNWLQYPSLPTGFTAAAVASGSTDAETWALGVDKTIWNLTGQTWKQVAGGGTQIAVFSETDTSCSTPQHSPVVLGTDGAMYFYQCGPKAFSFSNGSGADLSTDMAVGTDGNLYIWTGCAWEYYSSGPWGTDTMIGTWANGIFAMPSEGNDSFVVPSNCGPAQSCP